MILLPARLAEAFRTCRSIRMDPPSAFIFDTNGLPLFCGNDSLRHAILGWAKEEGREVIPQCIFYPPSDSVAIVFILLLHTL
jgi:hypothetical protein